MIFHLTRTSFRIIERIPALSLHEAFIVGLSSRSPRGAVISVAAAAGSSRFFALLDIAAHVARIKSFAGSAIGPAHSSAFVSEFTRICEIWFINATSASLVVDLKPLTCRSSEAAVCALERVVLVMSSVTPGPRWSKECVGFLLCFRSGDLDRFRSGDPDRFWLGDPGCFRSSDLYRFRSGDPGRFRLGDPLDAASPAAIMFNATANSCRRPLAYFLRLRCRRRRKSIDGSEQRNKMNLG